jgi:hypothetical protein
LLNFVLLNAAAAAAARSKHGLHLLRNTGL